MAYAGIQDFLDAGFRRHDGLRGRDVTATRVPAAKVSEVPRGGMKVVEASGVRIALCNVEGKIYAIEDVCTHDDGPLGDGRLDGFEAECPRHGARFDVRSGAVTRMPAVVPVRSFPVKIDGDSIYVEVHNGA